MKILALLIAMYAGWLVGYHIGKKLDEWEDAWLRSLGY